MKIKGYVKQSYNELVNKVTWPTWSDLQNSAIVVMIASFIIALVIYLMDISFKFIMDFIYKAL
ncbi:MAG: preprotein translocase subunit SecE [Bacteroidales bacterium]|nr:preprotein translocase subunit SecE [Bacteroidales bacterium]